MIEIDLLRAGKPFPVTGEYLGDYRILVSRSQQRPVVDLYAVNLKQPIPAIPIPLLSGETEPILELQRSLNYVYKRGRYHLAIDYTQPPSPPLSIATTVYRHHCLRKMQNGQNPFSASLK